jgi:hypothetical protein
VSRSNGPESPAIVLIEILVVEDGFPAERFSPGRPLAFEGSRRLGFETGLHAGKVIVEEPIHDRLEVDVAPMRGRGHGPLRRKPHATGIDAEVP